MFLTAIALALITGALLGGGLGRLTGLRLRWIVLLVVALGLRIGAQLLGRTDTSLADASGLLFFAGYLVLFAWLWLNRAVPGLQVAAVGIGSNAIAVIANLGHMPVWDRAWIAAGSPGTLEGNPFHFLLVAPTVEDFLAHAGVLGDVVPLPLPLIADVVSIGDLLLAAGIFWAIVFAMTSREGWQERASLRMAGVFSGRPMTLAPAAAGGASVAQAPPPGGLRPEPVILESSMAATAPMVTATPGGAAGTAAAPAER
ncbi:MAG: DUF5317 domain-containing protein, partial [Chloroflexota bacterium]|nr:DUF5317 domain-containing protein [Chloroflexota bacterium]